MGPRRRIESEEYNDPISGYGSCCVLLTCLACACPGAEHKPNVLFIAVDDLRPQLSCYDALIHERTALLGKPR